MNKSGWIIKEGGRYKSWKKRFMVLEGMELAYYKKDNKKEKCGFIDLQVSSNIEPVNYKKKLNCFQIQTPDRTYHICSPTPSDMDDWVAVLNNCTSPPEEDTTESIDKVGVDDFHQLRVIGKGSFGRVVLVKKIDTGTVYAMKILNKHTIIERNEVEHTISERSILTRLRHPFLMKLHYSFQTPDKLYFVMDYVNGGELFYHLQKDKCFPEVRVKFYAAEIVAGLEYLHNNGIIYRDLKPENLLLTSTGHMMMTDFGLSKEGMFSDQERATTFCGTPEYLAPEILNIEPYGKGVDWWSFGTLVYEMLTGLPPFYSEDVQTMYSRIQTENLEIPETIGSDAADLLKKLLVRNPEERLTEPEQIRSHPFFSDIDWDRLLALEVVPPFIPTTTGADDTQNIDEMFLSEPVNINESGNGVAPTGHDGDFEGFTYQSSPATETTT
eukprot:TRINITY_DN691_c0_g2_i3.p1 TRINITY_DN691_c0_g2~~TRINITY_DN691_c0_g2_i3.p1  ORF type:complete len:440 (+),score=112.98 TRINITY_DN691_c0_g2_i3:44-1363(+)